eukprot:jgi/Mesvir1/20302/Mv19900-RA.2
MVHRVWSLARCLCLVACFLGPCLPPIANCGIIMHATVYACRPSCPQCGGVPPGPISSQIKICIIITLLYYVKLLALVSLPPACRHSTRVSGTMFHMPLLLLNVCVLASTPRSMAAFHLGQFKSAKGCFATGYELDPQVSAYKMWMRKCDAELEEMGGDGEGQDQATPMVADEGVVPAKTTSPAADASAANQPQQAPAAAAPSASAPAPAPAAPPPKYRLDWYQNAKEVILAVLAKGLASDDVQVFYNSDQLGVDISRGGAHDCSIRLSLCGQIVPSECSHSVSKNKIEIKLRKAEPSQWGGLEAGKAITKVAAAPLAAAAPESSPEAPHLPAYPTSRKKAVDWDQLEAKIKMEVSNN